MKENLRQIPAIHDLQAHQIFSRLVTDYKVKSEYVTKLLRETIDITRNHIINGTWKNELISKEDFIDIIFKSTEDELQKIKRYYLTNTINATGTVLHTNLGRARLSDEATKHVISIAQGYSNLEYDLAEGERGTRHSIVEGLIKELTGAEAAMVVNNNAAAVFLVLRALAKDKEVLVSRGQLVEIGGSFRISSIMEESGAKLIEVGTTNKTHVWDYEDAITENTAMLLKVHTSNFKTVGFTESVEIDKLVQISNNHENIIVYEDLGSGVLYDFKEHGIGDEPLVKDRINHGVDLVSFSGDKLLGGPQAGIIAGKKELISKLKKHQLARVLRVDKMSYAALEATLLSYIRGAYQEVPTIRDILTTKVEIKQRCETFMHLLQIETSHYTCKLKEEGSPIGGGTMPGVEVSTYVVVLEHATKSANELASLLRGNSIPIITRIKHDEVLLDFRTVTESEIYQVVDACKSIS
ncbi:L-seryl-tRNA(Sec) selenium transferase [Fredinandcohnia humi]